MTPISEVVANYFELRKRGHVPCHAWYWAFTSPEMVRFMREGRY